MALSKLTDKQQAFVYEYIKDLNGTDAARRAGYKGTDNTLAVIAHENLRKPKIRAAIDQLLRERALTAAEVVSRLTDQARGIPEDCFTVFGTMIAVDFEKLREHGLLHLVKKVTYGRDGRPTIEFYDAQSALQLLGKYHKLFTDRVQVDDWRSQAIADIRRGAIDYEALAEAFDDTLAAELFRAAGVPVSPGES